MGDIPREQWSREDWAAATTKARRTARFNAAKARLKRIAEAEPRFTDDEATELAAILLGGLAS